MDYRFDKPALTLLEGFKAMIKLLEGYYEETKSEDVLDIVSFSALLQHARPVDSALWEDWIEAIDKKDTDQQLTPREAFSAMTKFLEDYYERGRSSDILSIINDLKLSLDHQTRSILQDKWLECILYILSKQGKAYGYLELYK